MCRQWTLLLLAHAVVAAAEPYPCLIEPAEVVELRSPVDGVIETVTVRRGDVLEKGQTLVVLQSDVQRAAAELAGYRTQMDGAIAAARTRIDYAKTKLERVKDLEKKQFVALQARDDILAELRLAEAELDAALEARELARIEHRRAQAELELRTIKSPFDGVVIDRVQNPGDLAESGSGRQAVLKVARTGTLNVDVVLPAAVFGRVQEGLSAEVRPAGSERTYTAQVDTVDRVIDAASSTFVARLRLHNPDLSIPVGLRCTADFGGVLMPAAE
ncbi:MAG: efflux RND transporter periplasmic adaptor subunit [Gammaproteobacteria bacterium]